MLGVTGPTGPVSFLVSVEAWKEGIEFYIAFNSLTLLLLRLLSSDAQKSKKL